MNIDNSFLARPSPVFRDSYLAALREGFGSGSVTHRPPHEVDQIASNFEDHLKTLDYDGQTPATVGGKTYPGVPSNTFWLVDEREFIGSISIRARIDTAILSTIGGHIGYGIRPSRSGRGYGSRQLALGLEIARGMGLGIARITCLESNVASSRIIERNGGLLIRRLAEHAHAPGPMLIYEVSLI